MATTPETPAAETTAPRSEGTERPTPVMPYAADFAIAPLLEERFYGAKSSSEIQQQFGLTRIRKLANASIEGEGSAEDLGSESAPDE